jgi:Protein of unknown function (DUF1579)
MAGRDFLLSLAGEWRGTSRLHDPHTNSPDDSPSVATVIPILNGRFVRLDYTWAYHGEPQQGQLLFGVDGTVGIVSAVWIDTWHMGDLFLVCRGESGGGPGVLVTGAYAAPPGPDWGWRTELRPTDDGFQLVMTNIAPDGKEAPAVEASYRRSY